MAHLLEDAPWLSGHYQCMDAETAHFERLSGVCSGSGCTARTQNPTSCQGGAAAVDGDVVSRVDQLEKENKELRKVTQDLQSMIKKLEGRVCCLEKGAPVSEKADAPKPVAAAPADDDDDDDDDDDFDMFEADEEAEAEAERLKEERIKAYAEKKSKKPTLIAKSMVIIDVKPWDDETDMKKVEEMVRGIKMDGLVWGASKMVPVGYGIKKLQISSVIEDDKVSTEVLEETIQEFEDFVQSTDIAAFNKL